MAPLLQLLGTLLLAPPSLASSLAAFQAVDIQGTVQNLAQFQGNVTVVVNVASFWGLTPTSYEQLQLLYEKYGDQGFVVLAFPSNQFGKQEPKSDSEILEFVQKYNVTFPMFSKIKVNGEEAIPLYKWLKVQIPGQSSNGKISWNFTKFLLDRNGCPYERFEPKEYPLEMESDIVTLLKSSYTSEPCVDRSQ